MTTAATSTSRTRAIAAGLGALVAIVTVLVGIPAALWLLGGNPLPGSVPSGGQIWAALTRPDDGRLFVAALTILGWTGWASYAVPLVLDIVSRLRSATPPRLPALRIQQRQVAALTGAVAALIALSAAPAAHAAQPAPTSPGITQTHPSSTPGLVEKTSPDTGTSSSGAGGATSPTTQAPDSAAPPSSPASSGLAKVTTRTGTDGVIRVTVERGDTMWGIAQEHLGTGSLYPRIAKASQQIQDDGRRLVDPDLIYPGWVLTVPTHAKTTNPAPAHDAPAAPSAEPRAPHDAPAAPAESAPATRPADASPIAPSSPTSASTAEPRHAAPSGTTSTAASTAAAQPPAVSGPASTPAPASTAPAAASPARSSSSASAAPSSGMSAIDARSQATAETRGRGIDGPVVCTAAGLSTLTAAGLLAALTRRRNRQTRRRRPGQRIPLPTGPAAVSEAQLRVAADPLAVADLDRVLRTIASHAHAMGRPLPALRAARLCADSIELYLVDESAKLPSPFVPVTADPGAWTFGRDHLQVLLTDDEAADIPAPYPTLVTLGVDETRAHLLLHLEEVGSLALVGQDAALCHEVLVAMAIDLITSCWSDDARITLVGLMPELAHALGSDRVTYVDDIDDALAGLRYTARVHRDALEQAGLSSAGDARTRHLADETWTPHLVLVSQHLTAQERHALAEIVADIPRIAVAAITSGQDPIGEWALTVTPGQTPSELTGVLAPAGFEIVPQRLSLDDLDTTLAAFRATDQPLIEGPDWTDSLDPGHRDLDTLPAPRADEAPPAQPGQQTTSDTAAPEDLYETDCDDETPTEAIPDPAAAAAPTPPDTDRTPAAGAAPATSTTPASATQRPSGEHGVRAGHDLDIALSRATGMTLDDIRQRPLLQLLGPIRLHRPQGTTTSPGRMLELLTYLAVHPGGTAAEFSAAIFPGERRSNRLTTKRNQYVAAARAWAGTAGDGHPYVCYVGEGGYNLASDMLVDLWAFNRLISGHIETASTDNLHAALALVDGAPFRMQDQAAYDWAHADENEIRAAVADVAHELAIRCVDDGDVHTAMWALEIGLLAERVNEALWRLLILATYQSGDDDGVDAVIERCREALEHVGGDLDAETVALLRDVRARREQPQIRRRTTRVA